MAVQLSEKETNLLALAWQCFEEPPKVNTKKLAEMGGYKNANSANACWFTLKKKLVPLNGVNAVRLSEKDVKLLVTVGQCFDNFTKVDTKKLAELGNYKNSNSANACWFALKKKLHLHLNPEVSVGNPGTNKRAAAAGEDGSDGNGEDQTPTKKKRARKPKTAAPEAVRNGKIKTEVSEEDEPVIEKAPTSAKKRGGRKPKAAVEEEAGTGTMSDTIQQDGDEIDIAVPKKGNSVTNHKTKAELMEDDDDYQVDDHAVAGLLAGAMEYTAGGEDDGQGCLG